MQVWTEIPCLGIAKQWASQAGISAKQGGNNSILEALEPPMQADQPTRGDRQPPPGADRQRHGGSHKEFTMTKHPCSPPIRLEDLIRTVRSDNGIALIFGLHPSVQKPLKGATR
jgi:hypothetical protein